MQKLLTLLCNTLDQGRSVALASVLMQQGSTPRGAGSRLLANAHGLMAGTIGGGVAEGLVLDLCRKALGDGLARLVDFDMTGALTAKSDMICGGRLRVLVEVLHPNMAGAAGSGPLRAVLHALHTSDCTDVEDDILLVTEVPAMTAQTGQTGQTALAALANVRGTARRALRVKGVWQGELQDASLLTNLAAALAPAPLPSSALAPSALSPSALSTSVLAPAASAPAIPREHALLTVEGREYFVERCLPPLRMIIAGGGHVSRPTAQIAALAGYEVTVLDDRPEFSEAARFPWATHVHTVPDFTDCFAQCSTGERTSIVILTRGHMHDAAVLTQALRTRAGYVGMIGSQRKKNEVYTALQAKGIAEEALDRVYCPVGLSIGAQTPEEIAVSIVAQCIAHRYKAPCATRS